jgi:hypothetical protein
MITNGDRKAEPEKFQLGGEAAASMAATIRKREAAKAPARARALREPDQTTTERNEQ